MLCRMMLAVASLLATGSQAYAPIQMVSSQGKGLVVLPRGVPGSIRGALTPQKLAVRNTASNDSPRSVPYFTAKLDQTISWDDADWCLEATGDNHGDAVRVNSCSGAQTQKWNWIPDGRGHNMIQLRGTELCLDAIDKDFGLNGAPIELRACGSEVAQWRFDEPLPLPGTSQGEGLSYEARHVMIVVLTLAAVGALSLGARIWQMSARRNQNRQTICAMMPLDPMHPSRVAQARASRTGNISMAEHQVAGNPVIDVEAEPSPPSPSDVEAKPFPSSPSGATESLKAEFRLKAARVNRGFSASAVDMASISALAEELERCNPEPKPTASPDLLGEWRLDFTDAADVLSLGLQPFSEIGSVFQNVQRDENKPGAFVAQNIVELLPLGSGILASIGLGASSRYAVEARCNVLSDTQVSIAFVGGSLQPLASVMGNDAPLPALSGTLPMPVIERIQELFADRVFLETTYLDADLRIARGPSMDLYVLSKV